MGVDIGSSTSHLVFSRLTLERHDTRYVVTERAVLGTSDILLTPYVDDTTIDGVELERFINAAFARAGLRRDEIDTGALILTGVALLRQNARAIADLFAEEAGRFVAVTAGDYLEALMAAHGSGAVELSLHEPSSAIMHVDIGGGTTKLIVCIGGKPVSLATMDVGARLVAWDADRRITRLEPAGRALAEAVGIPLELGGVLPTGAEDVLAGYLADRLLPVAVLSPAAAESEPLLRTALPASSLPIGALTFSGGVSEYLYGREPRTFGDLGPFLAAALRERLRREDVRLLEPAAGIRATVIGASQYTVQVSGTTIFLDPVEAVPVRNVPVVVPHLSLSADTDALDADAVARGVADALRHADLAEGLSPVALALHWEGSATYGRIDAFCRGVAEGLAPVLANGHPIVLVFDGDVGGLFGLHLKESLEVTNPVISIDNISLAQFDYVDIGELIPASGAVPVVIKSLVFSATGSSFGSAPAPGPGSGSRSGVHAR